MRARGMMNDNSQQGVSVTVLFIPERRKEGRQEGGKEERRTGRRFFYKLSTVEKLNT